MSDRGHRPPLSRQADLLGISRGSLYCDPSPVSATDVAIMRRIDELRIDYPFVDSRMLRDVLRGEGIAIERANQVWPMDITYILMARGFLYLAAVMEWLTRQVLAWRVSISMEVDFCLDAVNEALARYGRPEIFNADQGSQFTSAAFTGSCWKTRSASAMDGRDSWRDNVFVERLWRSVNYEDVYLRAYDTVAEARSSVGAHLSFCNRKRPHSSLDRRTPDQACFRSLSWLMCHPTVDVLTGLPGWLGPAHSGGEPQHTKHLPPTVNLLALANDRLIAGIDWVTTSVSGFSGRARELSCRRPWRSILRWFSESQSASQPDTVACATQSARIFP